VTLKYSQLFLYYFSMRLLSCEYKVGAPYYYYYLVCEAIGTAATPGLLCQPRVIVKMIVGKQIECRLAGETEILGENLPQRHFHPSQNPTRPDPRWEAGD
jgi:hypothetical protein